MPCSKCHSKPVYVKGLCKACYSKQRRIELASRGKCVRCGKNKISSKSKWYCYECLQKIRKKVRDKRDKQRAKDVGIDI